MENQILKICRFGEEILQQVAVPVTDIDERIRCLIERMRETMYLAPGVGLAAPQIGESMQLAVIDPVIGDQPHEFKVLINPEILESEGEQIDDEGCLSMPGFSFPICRFHRILLRYFDWEGKELRDEFHGFRARVVQHELDHLQGKLIIDHVSSLKRGLVKQEIKKLRRSGQW